MLLLLLRPGVITVDPSFPLGVGILMNMSNSLAVLPAPLPLTLSGRRRCLKAEGHPVGLMTMRGSLLADFVSFWMMGLSLVRPIESECVLSVRTLSPLTLERWRIIGALVAVLGGSGFHVIFVANLTISVMIESSTHFFAPHSLISLLGYIGLDTASLTSTLFLPSDILGNRFLIMAST